MDYKPGTTLMKSVQPFAHCLLAKFKSFMCDQCFTKQNNENNRLMRCSGCKFMHYCGKECQRIDWSVHKHECVKFRLLIRNINYSMVIDDDLVRILIRVLIMKNNDISNRNEMSADEIGLKNLSVQFFRLIQGNTVNMNM